MFEMKSPIAQIPGPRMLLGKAESGKTRQCGEDRKAKQSARRRAAQTVVVDHDGPLNLFGSAAQFSRQM
jgi:hypothetical protein